MDKGRKVFGIIFIIILLVVVVLGGYLLYDYISTKINAKEAAEVVDLFENTVIVVAIDDEDENNTIEEDPTPTISTGTTKKKTSSVSYKGYPVIGAIQIPKINVKYPIVDDTSVGAMEKAIVFLYGPGLNQVGNSVIAGHNYRNGGFFGNNKKLVEGDKIYITDALGNKLEYTITKKYITSDVDFDYASRDTKGAREISLSTCTNDASKRLVIWAKES